MDRRILKIDFDKAQVVDHIDGLHLLQFELKNSKLNRDEVLNGIAFHPESKNFVFTGKKWGHYYQSKISIDGEEL